MRSAVGALLLTLVTAAPASAQSVVLTEGSGRPLIIGNSDDLGRGLQPTALLPTAVVAEFQQLCLPDPEGAVSRTAASGFGLESRDVVFPATGKQQEAKVAAWRSPAASLSVWTGDDVNLKGRPIAITSRAYATTGPYGPFRAEGSQCNLVVLLPDFAAALQLSEALAATFGAPGKLVAKKTFADGYWLVASATPVRINYTAPTTRNGPQPVHLSAQVVGKENKR